MANLDNVKICTLCIVLKICNTFYLPKGFSYKALDCSVSLDYKAQGGELARAVAN